MGFTRVFLCQSVCPITLGASSIFGNTENAGSAGMTCGTFNKVCTLTNPQTPSQINSFSTQVSFNGTTIADMRLAVDAAGTDVATGTSYVL